jgi:hypothetical protein
MCIFNSKRTTGSPPSLLRVEAKDEMNERSEIAADDLAAVRFIRVVCTSFETELQPYSNDSVNLSFTVLPLSYLLKSLLLILMMCLFFSS